MSSAEDLLPFIKTGGILATVPNWDDIPAPSHKTIKEYYPSDDCRKDYRLTLVMRPDPKNPSEFIAQYDEPFGSSWSGEAIKYFKQLEFEYDSNPKHRYLYARNVSDVRLGHSHPDNWEIERFRIILLPGGQLSVWTYWERVDESARASEDDPIVFTYRAGYVWPPC